VYDEFSKNRSWAYFEKQKCGSHFAFQTIRNQFQDTDAIIRANPGPDLLK
jgi:hypothetical protein